MLALGAAGFDGRDGFARGGDGQCCDIAFGGLSRNLRGGLRRRLSSRGYAGLGGGLWCCRGGSRIGGACGGNGVGCGDRCVGSDLRLRGLQCDRNGDRYRDGRRSHRGRSYLSGQSGRNVSCSCCIGCGVFVRGLVRIAAVRIRFVGFVLSFGGLGGAVALAGGGRVAVSGIVRGFGLVRGFGVGLAGIAGIGAGGTTLRPIRAAGSIGAGSGIGLFGSLRAGRRRVGIIVVEQGGEWRGSLIRGAAVLLRTRGPAARGGRNLQCYSGHEPLQTNECFPAWYLQAAGHCVEMENTRQIIRLAFLRRRENCSGRQGFAAFRQLLPGEPLTIAIPCGRSLRSWYLHL